MRLPRPIRRFAADTRGSILVESVLILPLLVWAYVGTFTMFEAFRIETLNTRSSYVIGDSISRETNYITPDYIEGMNDVFAMMTQAAEPTILRVTVAEYDQETDAMSIDWSYATEGQDPHTPATLAGIDHYIPQQADGDKVIIVETWMQFQPLMTNIIDPVEYSHISITRPRFAAQVPWNAGT